MRGLLVLAQVLHQNLVKRFRQKEDLVATGAQLLDEDTLGEVLRVLAHISEIEDLN